MLSGEIAPKNNNFYYYYYVSFSETARTRCICLINLDHRVEIKRNVV